MGLARLRHHEQLAGSWDAYATINYALTSPDQSRGRN
jgi:hypothetical protein